jgi:integrase
MGRKDALRRAIESYLAEMKVTRSPSTYMTYMYASRALQRAVKAAMVTTYISRWTVEDIMKIMAQRSHVMPSTILLETTVLRGILIHSGIMTMETAIKSRRIRLPHASRSRVRWCSEETIADIRASCQADVEYVAVVLASELGLRRGEIARLRVGDISGDMIIVRGKGQKILPIPLTPSVAATLESWMVIRKEMVLSTHPMHVPNEVLIYKHGAELRPYQPASIYEIVSRVGQRMKMRLSTHDLRRSCGRELYRATRDLLAVHALLRHESLDQTRDYIGADLEDARRAMAVRDAKRASTTPLTMEPATEPLK